MYRVLAHKSLLFCLRTRNQEMRNQNADAGGNSVCMHLKQQSTVSDKDFRVFNTRFASLLRSCRFAEKCFYQVQARATAEKSMMLTSRELNRL